MEFRIKSVIVLLLAVIASAAVVRAPFAKSASATLSNSVQSVTTSSTSGRINEHYSYEGLEVNRGSYQSRKYGGRVFSCTFTGKINSTTHTEKRNVKIIFTALNNFKEPLWETTISINALPAFGTHEFSEKITCQERDPFFWEIAVIEAEPSGKEK
ncbi:MAG: hypothetical protein AB1724_20390 [Thermodesulfobacteriota bacterium]